MCILKYLIKFSTLHELCRAHLLFNVLRMRRFTELTAQWTFNWRNPCVYIINTKCSERNIFINMYYRLTVGLGEFKMLPNKYDS